MYVLISHSKINQYWHNNIRQNKPSYKVTNLPNLKGRRNIYFNLNSPWSGIFLRPKYGP